MRTVFQFGVVAIAFIILIGLGTWQLQRLEWKTGIIDQLEREYAKNPANHIYHSGDLTDTTKILYGSARGRFLYDKELIIGPYSLNKEAGYKVVTPLKTDNGDHILVQRGWIKVEDIEQLSDKQNRPVGLLTVSGVFRAPQFNKFMSGNSPNNDVWMRLDVTEISEAKNLRDVAPIVLYAETSSKEFGLIQMQAEKIMPRNKHLQYAVFWFSMAFILLTIYGIYYYQERKKKA